MAEGSRGARVLRSGEPKTSSSAAFFSHVVDATRKLTGVSFSYSYSSGFAAGAAANFSLVALAVDPCVDGPGPVASVLYSSPPLADFPFAACDDYTQQAPGGYLAGGDDVWSGDVTLEQAMANCSALPTCLAFTYNGPSAPAPGATVHAYLKSAVNFVESPGWETFVSSRVSSPSEPPPQMREQLHSRLHHGRSSHGHAHGYGHGRATPHAPSRHRRDLPPAPAAPARAERAADPAKCFSPAVPVSLSGLRIDVSAGVQLALLFDNNDRNVRLLLPIDVSVTWGAAE